MNSSNEINPEPIKQNEGIIYNNKINNINQNDENISRFYNKKIISI